MLSWNKLLSAKRFGLEEQRVTNTADVRSQFQRDFDRVIFSSPFRRLQNKTQVFPLPGSVFVHNRLTHSLEVASAGRSIANLIALELQNKPGIGNKDIINELSSIVSAACLCHDMGNPPFGHAGEEAISRFFKEGEGRHLQQKVRQKEWLDLVNFEGNANALRMLTHQFNGRRKGGFALTYTTLASLIKYPYASDFNPQKPKYGYFQSEKETFQSIADELGLIKLNSSPEVYARHPLAFIVEAADDICYEIMDIEDAHKLNILTTERTHDLLCNFFSEKDDRDFFIRKESVFREVSDTNERIAYLRASVINKLVRETAQIFLDNYDKIMKGEFNFSLIDKLHGESKKAFSVCKELAINEIYNHRSVVKIELTGYNVLGTLLKAYTKAVFNPGEKYSRKLLSFLPMQFRIDNTSASTYEKTRSVIDFVSGMTDLYAVDLFKDIEGIRL
ncbi:MAG: deoxyguanosinetriphosphate triphosphohydrolase [Bacteroidales bacterium]